MARSILLSGARLASLALAVGLAGGCDQSGAGPQGAGGAAAKKWEVASDAPAKPGATEEQPAGPATKPAADSPATKTGREPKPNQFVPQDDGSEDQAGPRDPSDSAAGDPADLAVEPPDEPKEAAPELTLDELFTIPEGATADELFAFLERMQAGLAPHFGKLTSEEEQAALTFRMARVVADTMAKALEAEPTEKQAQEAASTLLKMLAVMQMSGDEKAAADAEAWVEKLKDDKRPGLAELALSHGQFHRSRRWGSLAKEERKELIDEFVERLQKGEMSGVDLQTITTLHERLLSEMDGETALEFYKAVVPILAKYRNQEVRQLAQNLQYFAGSLENLGKEMELQGKLLDGTDFDWTPYKDKVVLVDFWATWCGPCIRELPNVLANYEKFHDQGFEVVGVSLDEQKEDVETFVSTSNIPWPIMLTEGGFKDPNVERFNIQGIPAAYLVQNGKIIWPLARGEMLGEQLKKIFGGEEGAPSETPAGETGEAPADEKPAEEKSTDEKPAEDKPAEEKPAAE